MPINYLFKDSKTSDTVAKALLFVAKFSKKQALVKFSDSSVGIIWGGSPKTYFIHTEATALDMFKNRQQLRLYGIDHCTIIQVNPSTMGKTLKGGTSDRNVYVTIIKPNKVRVTVESGDNNGKRTIVHTLPCEIKTLEDYRSMLIEAIESNVCRYDTKSYVDNIHRFKHIVDSFVKLNTQKIYLWSKQTDQGNDLTVTTRTPGSNVNVSLSDLENGHENFIDDIDGDSQNSKSGKFIPRRNEAGVNIDTKKLAFFLSSLIAQKRSKVCFEIEHNKCLKITLDNEIMQGEKFFQSLLLLHSLNN